MHRILLATTALVALSSAPAFAFNTAIVVQAIGSNLATSNQDDNGGTGGNTLLGAQVGVGNIIDNGVCFPDLPGNSPWDCIVVDDVGQNAALGLNNAVVVQGGVLNYTKNRQAAVLGVNNHVTVQLGGLNSSVNNQAAVLGVNNNVTGQIGVLNSATTNQAAILGVNNSLTGQAGINNKATTNQFAVGGTNDAWTLQGGVNNTSATDQEGNGNEAFTLQLGAGNYSSTSQSGTGQNWSSVTQVGSGNVFVGHQSN